MQNRPGMRLHRDAVVRAERMEIERGHDRGHRRAARLVPAYLQAVIIPADVIGVMDGPRRQPAQAIVESLQGFDVGGYWFEHPAAVAAVSGVRNSREPVNGVEQVGDARLLSVV